VAPLALRSVIVSVALAVCSPRIYDDRVLLEPAATVPTDCVAVDGDSSFIEPDGEKLTATE